MFSRFPKGGKPNFWFSLVIPLVVVLGILIYLQVSGKGRRRVLITAEQLKTTEGLWSSQNFTDISDSPSFWEKFSSCTILGLDSAPSELSVQHLREVLRNLVLANINGDYDSYIKFRLPSVDYVVNQDVFQAKTEWFQDIFPKQQAPTNFFDLDRSIWEHYFKGHPFWKAIAIDSARIDLIQTNAIPQGHFPVFHQDPKKVSCMTSTVPPSFLYDSAARQALQQGILHFANVTFIVKAADPPDVARPFFYSFLWDPTANTWIPWQLSHCTTKNYNAMPPF
jgi:hypothetical protein